MISKVALFLEEIVSSFVINKNTAMKYILVTGGVISGIGKGIISSSIGTILISHGFRVTSIKVNRKKDYQGYVFL